jgi:hypothetical protein
MITLRLEEYEKRARSQIDMEQRYRNVFGSDEGMVVLGDILARNHFGVPLNNEIERYEYNVAIEIARMSGMLSAIDQQWKISEG